MQANWDGGSPSPSLRRCAPLRRGAPGETEPMFSTSLGTLKREREREEGEPGRGTDTAKDSGVREWHG